MEFHFDLGCAELSSLDAGLLKFWKLVFSFQKLLFIGRFHGVVTMLSIFGPKFFQESSHVNTAWCKKSEDQTLNQLETTSFSG